MGKNWISSFACNTIKSLWNNEKWREQQDVSQPHQWESSERINHPLHIKKIIKSYNWNFLTTIWTNDHQALLDSACQIELKFPWIRIHNMGVKMPLMWPKLISVRNVFLLFSGPTLNDTIYARILAFIIISKDLKNLKKSLCSQDGWSQCEMPVICMWLWIKNKSDSVQVITERAQEHFHKSSFVNSLLCHTQVLVKALPCRTSRMWTPTRKHFPMPQHV